MDRSRRFAPAVWLLPGRRKGGMNMTLLELSVEYRASAAALRERALLLESQQREEWNEANRMQLADRIKLLRTMWREARDLAVLCERYYDRGYRRNVKYTV